MPSTPSTLRQAFALAVALAALAGPLAGMTLVSLTAPLYVHHLQALAPSLLACGLVFFGGGATGLALLPSFFLGAVCGFLLPSAWSFAAAALGLAWATLLGLSLGRLFSTNFLEVLLRRKAAWWDTYQRLGHAESGFLSTAVALLRLAPHMPFALTNLVCARLPLTMFGSWLASYIGLLPRTLFAVHIGNQLQDWQNLLQRDSPPWEILLSLVLLALLTYLGRRAARRLEAGTAPPQPIS